jgi:hypothetical protein
MLGRFKKAFSLSAPSVDVALPVPFQHSALSKWATFQGLSYVAQPGIKSFSVEGTVNGKAWKMTSGLPSREFIKGDELLARAVLNTLEDVSVLVISRSLKESLEQQAFKLSTDSNQTNINPTLPVEAQWLAAYKETGWSGLPGAFWVHYAVIANRSRHASAWISPAMAELLLSWPDVDPRNPFLMMLIRGKAYMRMQHTGENVAAVEHAVDVFTSACKSAMENLSPDIEL